MTDAVKELKKSIINCLTEGNTLSRISAKLFGTSSTAKINRFMSDEGIEPWKYNSRYYYMRQDWLAEKIKQGMTPGEIAQKYDMPRTSVSRYALRYGLYESKFSRKARNDINESYFKEIDSKRKAYWLGYIMADGNIYTYKDGSNKIQFSIKLQESDSAIIESFARDIGFDVQKIRHGTSQRNDAVCKYVELRSYNKTFCKNLINHGIVPQKGGKEIIPKTIPLEFRGDFIRGFWDGDGHLDDVAISAVTSSPKMLSDLSIWLSNNNIFFKVHCKKEQGSDVLLYLICIPLKSKLHFLEVVYPTGCFGLKRKCERANKIKQSILLKSKNV